MTQVQPSMESSTKHSPTADKLVGIVTVLYNSDDVLDGFFASLATQSNVRLHLYVIDNGATPSGTEIARELAVRHGIAADFVFNNANVGVARGNNQGIELALRDGCTHVLLANNDTEFASDTISKLVDALVDGERVATPKITYHGTDSLIWFGGGAISPWTALVPHFGMLERDNGQCDGPRHTDYAPTCFMLLEASVLRQVGRMDERYFVYYDDADFVWRMSQQNLRIRYVANSIVEHKVSTSTGGADSPFTVYWTNRNRIYFIRKNFHGMRRLFALTYALSTRLLRVAGMRGPLARRMCAGIWDGFRLPLHEARPR